MRALARSDGRFSQPSDLQLRKRGVLHVINSAKAGRPTLSTALLIGQCVIAAHDTDESDNVHRAANRKSTQQEGENPGQCSPVFRSSSPAVSGVCV